MTHSPSSSANAQPLIDALAQTLHFNSMSVEVQNAILTAAIPKHFTAGQVIYLEGEPADYVYILASGWVKATRMTPEGREQALLILRPVEIFGDIAVFSSTPYPGTATALEEVHAWAIPAEIIIAMINQHPELAMAVIRKMSDRVLYYIGLVEDLSLRSVEARLAKTLLANATLHGGQLIVPRRGWSTFDEMADRLGTVRDVLSRALKALEAEGLLRVEKQAILLLDPKGLAERAGA